MNDIALILRKESFRNIFRQVVLDSFKLGNTGSILLCSGFFQERGTFSASKEILQSINGNLCRAKITIVGYYGYLWTNDFNNFCLNLSTNTCPPIVVEKRRSRHLAWHSKVFIVNNNDDIPVLAIIGSSNMTSRAFGINHKFNYESDVILWNLSNSSINEIIINRMSGSDYESEIIFSKYDETSRFNQGMQLSAKIKSLENEIIQNSEIV
jgi:phosphatidylserine/phosphatidylglycerophosphate/cardiolipin synthase-like enzyme